MPLPRLIRPAGFAVIAGGGAAPIGAYTASQSSVEGGSSAATYATLTDNNSTTGTTIHGTGWIQATFPAPVTVSSVGVAGNTSNLDGRVIQHSTDDSTWIDAATISGANYSTAPVYFTLSSPVTAQYWRIYDVYGYLTLGEFRFA